MYTENINNNNDNINKYQEEQSEVFYSKIFLNEFEKNLESSEKNMSINIYEKSFPSINQLQKTILNDMSININNDFFNNNNNNNNNINDNNINININKNYRDFIYDNDYYNDNYNDNNNNNNNESPIMNINFFNKKNINNNNNISNNNYSGLIELNENENENENENKNKIFTSKKNLISNNNNNIKEENKNNNNNKNNNEFSSELFNTDIKKAQIKLNFIDNDNDNNINNNNLLGIINEKDLKFYNINSDADADTNSDTNANFNSKFNGNKNIDLNLYSNINENNNNENNHNHYNNIKFIAQNNIKKEEKSEGEFTIFEKEEKKEM
jgi:hypothetical protein